MSFAQEEWRLKNQWASDWMHQGIDLLGEDSAAALEQAVRCFDQAIALRRTLPLAENPFLRYGLSAGWINRGDALARLEGESSLAEAVNSYDEALVLLKSLPLEENPLYPRRLAIAWINRGTALQKRSVPGTEEAAECFRSAIGVLEHPSASALADLLPLQSGAWLNLAGALAYAGEATFEEARRAARQALALAQPAESTELALAETALKARHVICRLLIKSLADQKAISPDLHPEALEAVSEAMFLARHWKCQGHAGLDGMAQEIFRFGCRIHEKSPPRLLARFLEEWLEGEAPDSALILDPKSFATARAAIWSALGHLQSAGFPMAGTPAFESFLAEIQELKGAEERLQLRLAGEN